LSAESKIAHPNDVLLDGGRAHRVLPSVDHYCGTEARIAKALALQQALTANGRPTFDVTADCEDGALAGAEAEQAELVGSVIESDANHFNRVGVRVHPPASEFFQDDLERILKKAADRVAYITLPKIDSFDECTQAIDEIDRLTGLHVRSREDAIPVHVLIESPLALRDVDAIARHPRVECLSFGLMDYVSSFEGAIPDDAMTSPGQFEHPLVRAAKVQVVLAAHAHRKVASHNVSIILDAPDRVEAEARRAADEFGFTRMWSIHPAQIAVILRGLAPATRLIEESAGILLAARAASWAPVSWSGRLHDRASYRFHWQRLRRAHEAGSPIPPAAQSAFF